ncbi:polyamine ABC transporter substrate-binding protein [Pseudomonas sp. EpS/L25]|uniref:polyamine ABC transporter substrate-binding protein n=1 Tax=Pseudomonas sp. EpS/L25 TaxID=1749078 RepID=UPI000743D85D|nr:spermidine/putrescine ABC transporter substrate-binding protein [Pseudomonas sp. EpS/L25]KUM39668.1 spermidine/putrescine ABC transporter substrate-binding protein [Pseudomonas sp. EpS/L25]
MRPRRMLLLLLWLVGLPLPLVADPLRLYTWEGYFSDTLLQRWAKANPPLQEIHFDSSDVRDATLARGDAALDLVVINEVSATRLGRDGLLTRIDSRRIAHLAEIDPRWRSSCGDYAVPYVWGTLGLLYRADRLTRPPDSWQALLQPEPALHGRIAMLEDHDDLLVAPLLTLGGAINSDDAGLLRRSFDLLKAQAPAVLTYQYVVSALRNPAYSDHIDLALGYSGDQHLLNAATPGQPWRFVTPHEGSLLWVDCVAILSSSTHQAAAERFIDFLNEPRNALLASTELHLATANAGAVRLLSTDLRQDPSLFPPAEVLARSQTFQEGPPDTFQTRQRIGSALVGRHESQ